MSSGFVSEAELQKQRETRQQEWEKVRTEDQPIEAPEPEYDHRTLYDRLQEQKDKKQEEWEESRKFKNQIKNLDEDECSFLDLVDKSKIEQQSKINREENKELEEFRKAQASAEQEAAEHRLKAEVQKPMASQPGRPTATGSKRTQSQLLAGVVKKKARTNSSEEAEKKPAANSAETSENKEKTGDGDEPAVANKVQTSPISAGVVEYPSALQCVGILPGVGVYSDSSDSDSDASSDISWPKPKKMVVSSASTAESHKGHAGSGSNCKG